MKKLVKIKDTLSISKTSKGFTLLELLVVVLIIGILAGIALPQYQMAVTKAKVAAILPLMRRWKDALAEYKLQHGDYGDADADILGVNWPSDWSNEGKSGPCGYDMVCENDYWYCYANEDPGSVYCWHGGDSDFMIEMYAQDFPDEEVNGRIQCIAWNKNGSKICKALGGKVIYEEEDSGSYFLN